jgi:DNA repair exonuclease SbcCD ATPase subunit
MKDYSQKLQVLQSQREKALEMVHKDIEGLNSRQRDLNKQLDSMQSKYKVLSLLCVCLAFFLPFSTSACLGTNDRIPITKKSSC